MKRSPMRVRYFSHLVTLLLASYIIFFSILCLVEFRKAFLDSSKLPEAAHEVGVFLLVGLASLPLAFMLAWRITRRLLQPLEAMARTAERISGGRFSERIPPSRTYDELFRLAESFNLAFDRYEGAIGQLRSFSADAAHQLRTPLAAIRSTGEAALLAPRDSATYADTIGQMLDELRALSGMVDQLLQLAQLEAGTLRRSFAPCSLAAAVRSTLERFAPLAEAKHIALETQLEGSPPFNGNPALLEQALANLIDNAIRHTPENGTIRVALRRQTVVVEDSGPGIADPLLPHVFEQFRSGAAGQSGLGLAIAQRIVQLHGGEIFAENRSEGGARFTIKLPATPEP